MIISSERNKGNYPENVKREKIGKLITEFLEKYYI